MVKKHKKKGAASEESTKQEEKPAPPPTAQPEVSPPVPSSSSATTQPPASESSGASKRSKKRQQQATSAAAPSASETPAAPAVSPPVPSASLAPSQPAETAVAEEKSGESKRSKKRQQKAAPVGEVPEQATVSPAVPAQPTVSPPVPTQQQPAETSGTGGRNKKRQQRARAGENTEQTPEPVQQEVRGQTPHQAFPTLVTPSTRPITAGRGEAPQSQGRGQTVGRGITPPPGFVQPPAQQRGREQISSVTAEQPAPSTWGRATPIIRQEPPGFAPPTGQPGPWGRGQAVAQTVIPPGLSPPVEQQPGPLGRAQQDKGRGQSERGRGQAERGRGQAERGRGQAERGGGHADRGRGQPDRGRGGQQRGGQRPAATQQPVLSPATSQTAVTPSPGGVTTLTESFAKISIIERKTPKSCGTLGRRIPIETNHLPMQLNNIVKTAYHYDVTIDPDKPKRMMRRVWEAYRMRNFPKVHPAFDDVKNAYSPVLLPDSKLSGEVELTEEEYDKPKKYKIALKYANDVNLTALTDYFKHRGRAGMPQDALQCIDIVLRNASALRFVKVQRSFFTPPVGQVIDLGNGMELWHGFFQSAILGWKPYLNVDIANKGFPKEMKIIALMAEVSRQTVQNMDEIDYNSIETISKHLKGLKIRYEIPTQPSSKRSIRVNALINTGAKDTRFQDQDGVTDTVYSYFVKTKNYKIQYPKLPLVWVGPRDKKFYLPAELCTILPGQVTQKKLNENQTRMMVRNAATSTDIRKRKIMDAIYKANINDDQCVRAFGISIASQFEQIKARVLSPPNLAYNTREVTPQKGVWRNEPFLSCKPLLNWKVLNLARNIKDREIDNFTDLLKRTGERQCNMQINPVIKPYEFMPNVRNAQSLNPFFEKNKNLDLIFVIVPEWPPNVYSLVKQQAELVVGCLTQCIKDKTMQRSMNPATVTNILLKVNAKLNGVNHVIAKVSKPKCLLRPCMIMGADVNHPSPDQRDRPSYAAVTASHDPNAFQYNICWRLQESKVEIIQDLENIVVEHLKFFHERNPRYKPDSIIFFRDGVSEGQFADVLNCELQAIRRACSRMEQNYQPKITFLVVQKRHHTRFFPQNPRDSEDRNNNVPAGTIVDTDIIHPSDIEYYLVSHASIQGVARPTKYRMLWDDSDMSDDEIQSLTYFLCHLFTRCNRSVSYPAPTYYAHLAAARAHTYFEGKTVNMTNLNREQQSNMTRQEICKGKPMFFV